jgi:hypothetical protein
VCVAGGRRELALFQTLCIKLEFIYIFYVALFKFLKKCYCTVYGQKVVSNSSRQFHKQLFCPCISASVSEMCSLYILENREIFESCKIYAGFTVYMIEVWPIFPYVGSNFYQPPLHPRAQGRELEMNNSAASTRHVQRASRQWLCNA